MDRLEDTLSVADAVVADYVAIDLAGGHGAMCDFESYHLAKLVAEFYEVNKVVPPCATSHVVEDRRLITGQNSGSAHAVGKAVIGRLEAEREQTPGLSH